MNEELTDIQFQILDSLYFVERFEHVLEEAEQPRTIVINELRTMIDRGWIQVMMFNLEEGDFRRTNIFDTDHLEDYSYLATKDGLLKHNGFK
ncbi:MAG: hypothetical protein AB8H47_23485 [Bacteroidia bacterium]